MPLDSTHSLSSLRLTVTFGARRDSRDCIVRSTKGPRKNKFRFWRRPSGLGLFGRLASLLTPHRPLRVCSSFAPRQPAKYPPAKSEVIFARTLRWIAVQRMAWGLGFTACQVMEQREESRRRVARRLRGGSVQSPRHPTTGFQNRPCPLE